MASSIIVANNSRFLARRSSTTQNLTVNAFNTIVFDTSIIDTHSQYSTSTGAFTCGTGNGGWWHIRASVRMVATSSFGFATLSLIRNTPGGEEDYRLQEHGSLSGGMTGVGVLNFISSSDIFLLEGDFITVRTYPTSAGSISVPVVAGLVVAQFAGRRMPN